MTLVQYFRLINAVIFQPTLQLDYRERMFLCPLVYAKDGFHVSLQIHNGAYCSSENGYRKSGLTWDEVEFGFTSLHEPLMDSYAETTGDTTETVGRIPIEIMEDVLLKHGGIDWDASLGIDNINQFLRK